jgi:hypothetical protein
MKLEEAIKKGNSKEARRKRQAKRRSQLNAAAKYVGFGSWSKLETAVINGEYILANGPDNPAKVER